MINIEICAQVSEVGIGTIEFNGFPYSVVKINVGTVEGFYAFIPLYCLVDVGTKFVSRTWSITAYTVNEEEGIRKLAARFDNIETVTDREISPAFTAKVTGMVIFGDKSHLQYISPVRKPFYKCTLRIVDEVDKPYGVLLVAFKDYALRLSTIPCQTIVRTEVNIRKQKWNDDFEMCVDSTICVVDKDKEEALSENKE